MHVQAQASPLTSQPTMNHVPRDTSSVEAKNSKGGPAAVSLEKSARTSTSTTPSAFLVCLPLHDCLCMNISKHVIPQESKLYQQCACVTTGAPSGIEKPTTDSSCPERYKQCGGKDFKGRAGCCKSGDICTYFNDYYHQCLQGAHCQHYKMVMPRHVDA